MKKYMVYMDDGVSTFKIAVPAKDEKAATEYVKGNGEVIAVKDVTSDYPIDLNKVYMALYRDGFGAVEIDFITRCLLVNGIAEQV